MHISDRGRASIECVRQQSTRQREGKVDAGVLHAGLGVCALCSWQQGERCTNDTPEPAYAGSLEPV